ncbi:MAG: helix-turn-helix domain-containing protein [Eubacteriales bacterium]|nr:helix-turn-helix domain-containing protein [Eubacteriales bacterium]
MNEQQLRQLLCLSQGEQQYLAKKFDHADEQTSITIDYHEFLQKHQMIAARMNNSLRVIPRHTHNYIEMIYVYRGGIVHQIGGTELIMHQGDLLLMNQYTEHSERFTDQDGIGVVFIIRPEFFDIPLQMIHGKNEIRDFLVNSLRKNNPQSQYLLFRNEEQPRIDNLMENLIETAANGCDREDAISQYTIGLIFLHLLGSSNSRMENFSHGHRDSIVRETQAYIESHYSTVTLGQIAHDFHQPLSTMSKIIKEETGCTFRELLMQKRFQKAVQLLLETDLRVEEIAIHVGYENLSYFYRQFKKRCGMTPRQYRLIHRKSFSHRNSG